MNFSASSRISIHSANSGNNSYSSLSNYPLFDFYIGLGLAISSSLFIGSSFIIKKKALIKLAQVDCTQRASEGGFGYLREWLWWFGVLTMGTGEACNFAAYAFAPASLVTPLGALSVIVTAMLSSKLLKERLNLLGKIGCAVCLLGSTVIVIHSPKEEEVSNMADLALKMRDAGFIFYIVAVIVVSLVMIICVAPRFGHSNILVYIFICSIIGSLSVLSVKGLGLAIKETIGGEQQFTNFLTWFWLVAVIVCISVQLEWSSLGASDVLGNVVGFLITIIGIFQMQLFRDVNITLRHLRMLIHRSSTTMNSFETMNSGTSLVDELPGSSANSQQLYT
uniref:Magnesium transporter n=1 Tax=Setaria digitata TaxID=48799 RepID=A0A915PF95_9BILA